MKRSYIFRRNTSCVDVLKPDEASYACDYCGRRLSPFTSNRGKFDRTKCEQPWHDKYKYHREIRKVKRYNDFRAIFDMETTQFEETNHYPCKRVKHKSTSECSKQGNSDSTNINSDSSSDEKLSKELLPGRTLTISSTDQSSPHSEISTINCTTTSSVSTLKNSSDFELEGRFISEERFQFLEKCEKQLNYLKFIMNSEANKKKSKKSNVSTFYMSQ